MDRKEIIDYYEQEGIVNSVLKVSEDREVSGTLSGGGYTTRPNILQYKNDFLSMVENGSVAFHGSVERWKNPMKLDTKMRKEDLDRLRKGWDLILDIDSELDLEAAKLAASRILELMEDYGIEDYGVKFSGRRGFHIGIPWEAFPKKLDFEKTRKQFPKIPQAVVSFLREEIKSDLLQDLIELKGSFHKLSEELKGHVKKMTPFAFVEVEKDWGKRHLFRLPYSLHEKTWLVSYPLKKEELEDFQMEDAKPEKVEPGRRFLKDVETNCAKDLVVDAVNWMSKKRERREEEEEVKDKKIKPEDPVPEERFPPCIKNILEGLPDGRKRSVFVLITFLRRMSWDWGKVEEKLEEWNRENNPPLSENYINTQLKWFKRQDRELVSPSCDHDLYYKSFGVCEPDEKCKQGTDEIQIKNPVVYPFKK
ncbi:MAG: DNA primase small subunit domain-containing protein [Candidatus Aenigmatarchaeota archaeon]